MLLPLAVRPSRCLCASRRRAEQARRCGVLTQQVFQRSPRTLCRSLAAPSVLAWPRHNLACKASLAPAAPNCVVPIVKIDNIHDPFATIVSVSMGDELSEMLEMVSASPPHVDPGF